MFKVDRNTYQALWGLVGIVEAGGWTAYALAGEGNRAFFAVLVTLSVVLVGGLSTLVGRGHGGLGTRRR